MKVQQDKTTKEWSCSFDKEEQKTLRMTCNMIKSSSNRLTDDLNRYKLDFSQLNLDDIISYATTINIMLRACIHLAHMLSDAESRLVAEQLPSLEVEDICHSEL